MKISKLILPMALAATAATPISMVACSQQSYSLKINVSDANVIKITKAPKTLKKGQGYTIEGTFDDNPSAFIYKITCNKKDVTSQSSIGWEAGTSPLHWTINVDGKASLGKTIVRISIA